MSVEVQSEPAGPKIRLHRSTWLVLLVATVVLAVIIVPGMLIDTPLDAVVPMGARTFLFAFEHGWPWTFLRREIEIPTFPNPLQVPQHGIPWLQHWAWSFAGNIGDRPTTDDAFKLGWWPGLLAADLLIAFAILAALAAALEWRRRRRRLWQFTLGEMLVLTLACAAVLGWWAGNRRAYAREVSAAERDGVNFGMKYCGPKWLSLAVGIHQLRPFFRITHLNTGDASDHYAGLAQWAVDFPHVDLLYLHAPIFTFGGEPSDLNFGHMADFPRLRTLSLTIPYINETQFAPLTRLPQLREFFLTTDERAVAEVQASIGRMQGLRKLTIYKAGRVDNAGLNALAQLKQLESLTLRGAKIDDAGMKGVVRLQNLHELGLPEATIEDRSLEHLQKLPRLKWLYLNGTGLGDPRLVHLEEIKTLTWLDLRGTQATQETVNRLYRSLPNCFIRWPK